LLTHTPPIFLLHLIVYIILHYLKNIQTIKSLKSNLNYKQNPNDLCSKKKKKNYDDYNKARIKGTADKVSSSFQNLKFMYKFEICTENKSASNNN